MDLANHANPRRQTAAVPIPRLLQARAGTVRALGGAAVTRPGALARASIGGTSLWFFEVSASAPLTVLIGAVVTMYATTGVVGTPLAFLVLTLPLALLTVGFVAASRHVGHAATFFALPAAGLGPAAGLVGAAVALLAYNCIQISLYGLIGVTLAATFGGPWFLWPPVVCAAIAITGRLRVPVIGLLLGALLIAELGVIVVFGIGAVTNPAGGHLSWEPLRPDRLLVDGVGGVFAFAVASFVGYESGAAYSEEARTDRSVGRATFVALLFLGLFYAASSWALAVVVGPAQVADRAKGDAELPLTVMAQTTGIFGDVFARIGGILLITSIFATMLSFHSTVARYVFALARDRVLWKALDRTGTNSRPALMDAPIRGSLVQTLLAIATVAGFAVAGADPITELFTWLASIAAIAVLVLLVLASLAAVRYFRRGGGRNEGVFVRLVAPITGAVLGVAVLVTTVDNLGTLLNAESGSPLKVSIPSVVGVAILAGLAWAAGLRRRRPQVYQAIGRNRPHPLRVPDARLADVRL